MAAELGPRRGLDVHTIPAVSVSMRGGSAAGHGCPTGASGNGGTIGNNGGGNGAGGWSTGDVSAQVREETLVETLRMLGYSVERKEPGERRNIIDMMNDAATPVTGAEISARTGKNTVEEARPKTAEDVLGDQLVEGWAYLEGLKTARRILLGLEANGFSVARKADPALVRITIAQTIVDPTVILERVRHRDDAYTAAKVGRHASAAITKALDREGLMIVHKDKS